MFEEPAFGDLQEEYRNQGSPRVKSLVGYLGFVLADLPLEEILIYNADRLGEKCHISHERDGYICGAKTMYPFQVIFYACFTNRLGQE
jgi:hypothetical protein